MNDLIAAAATIQGAQIQANYALWAAVISSMVGAGGIIFAANFAFKSGLKTQQHNNILEAKREVYLEAIARYQQIINNLELISVIPNRFLEIFLNDKKDFFVVINKVQLICNIENKHIVDDLRDNFDAQTKRLLSYIHNYVESEKSKEEMFEKYINIEKELHKFQLNNPQLRGVGTFLDTAWKIQTDLHEQLSKSRIDFHNAKDGNNFNLEMTQEKVKELIDILNDKFIVFSERLRMELKEF